MPDWRKWQTQQTQNLPTDFSFPSSTLGSGTFCIQTHGLRQQIWVQYFLKQIRNSDTLMPFFINIKHMTMTKEEAYFTS